MFELIPFDRRGSRVSAYDPFRMLDDMERSFFGGNSHPAMSSFRTDVTDTGDAFVLDAELPGFKKEDIKIDAPWTIACQSLLSMEFSRQEYWSGWPSPSPMHESEKCK